MMNGSIALVQTSLVAVGSNVTTAQSWNGGQGVLVISATQYAPIVNLIYTMPIGDKSAGNSVAYKFNTSVIAANAIMPLQLPAGLYSIHSATGSTIGMHAFLCPTP